MKFRLICLAAVTLLLSVVLAAQEFRLPEERYLQHKEAPAYTPCADHGTDTFCSHLPVVCIDTGGQTIPGEVIFQMDAFDEPYYTLAEDGSETIQVQISVIDHAGGNNHLDDPPTVSSAAAFRIRGHASRRFEKSPYLLKFVDEAGLPQDLSVMGMDAHNKWVLHGPFLDKSLVRNYLCYNWAGQIMEYAPNVRFCEVFLDGEYRGLYLMTETIDNGDGCRLQLNWMESGVKATGYLLRIDRTTEADVGQLWDIYSYMERMLHLNVDIQIKYPGVSTLTPELSDSIERDFAAFEKCMYSYDFNSREYGYENWIDTENFIDYFILNELTWNHDAGKYSTYLYKDISGKYKLCVWDFNNAFDNFPEEKFYPDEFFLVGGPIYSMLFRDKDFEEQVLERYRELRQGVLSEENMCADIDDTLAYLGPAVERNNQRWAAQLTSWGPLKPLESDPADRNVYSHEAAVEQLKDFIHQHGRWMDKNIDLLKQYSNESRNKAYLYD